MKKKILLLILILIFYLVYFSKENFYNKEKKYIFIAGLHRSGTTILNEILGSSSKISKHMNTGVYMDEGQHIQSVFDNGEKHGGVGKFCFDNDYHYTEDSNLITESNKIKLLKEWNKYWDVNKNIFLEKSPTNLIRTRFLQKLFKNSYFIIMIRHPLAVSNASFKWNKQSLEKYFDHWIKGYNIFLSDSKYLKNFILIRYEDLCENSSKEINRIEMLINENLDIKNDELKKLYNSNGKYFNKIDKLLINKYEKSFNKFGYSLKNI